MAVVAAPEDTDERLYDEKDCGFSIKIKRNLEVKGDLCALLYFDDIESPFFYGVVSSRKLKSKKEVFGFFKISNGEIFSSRIDYRDDERDVSQKIIGRKIIESLKKTSNDYIIASLVKVSYEKETPGDRELRVQDEIYECLDGFFYGSINAVSFSLCNISGKSSGSWPDMDDWKFKAIQSLEVR